MVRRANKLDIEAIISLGLLLNIEYNKLYDINKIINNNNELIYVYEDGNVIKGFLHIMLFEDFIDVINIAVDINYRNKGIASKLMAHMLNNMSKTVKYLTLEVAVNNSYAIRLYEKFNFKIISIRKCYYHDIDAYLMRKEV